MSYHRNELIGLTVWNSDKQDYYLVPFSNVSCYFMALSEVLLDVTEIKNASYEFLSTYDPKTEIVLLSFNEDLVTVAIVDKSSKYNPEAVAERLGWSLDRLTSFLYLYKELAQTNEAICEIFNLTEEQFDEALGVILD
jgi:hypothetical protein